MHQEIKEESNCIDTQLLTNNFKMIISSASSFNLLSNENEKSNSTDNTNNNSNLSAYLAIDCNLDSYSSLSSSSSSSSCCSTNTSSNEQPVISIETPITVEPNNSNLEPKQQLLKINPKINSNASTSLFKNKIIMKKRNNYLSSSNNSSGDEGYVGSYTDLNNKTCKRLLDSNIEIEDDYEAEAEDISNANKKTYQKQVEQIQTLINHLSQYLNEQEKLNLITYLINHKFDYNNNNSKNIDINNDSNVYNSFSLFDHIDNNLNESKIDEDKNDCSQLIQIPNLFNRSEIKTYVENNKIDNKSCYDLYNLYDISNRLDFDHHFHTINTKLTHSESTGILFDDFKLANQYELIDLQNEIEKIKLEQERQNEQELMSKNWRSISHKLNKQKEFNLELKQEDDIDSQAYLNEIEMNLDYFQFDSICIDTDDVGEIDTMLKFKTNKMAFNLRKHHIELEKLKKEKNNNMKKLFENFDEIPEFRPYEIIGNNYEDEYFVRENQEVCFTHLQEVDEENGCQEDDWNTNFNTIINNETDYITNENYLTNLDDKTITYAMDTTVTGAEDELLLYNKNTEIDENSEELYSEFVVSDDLNNHNMIYYQSEQDFEDYEDQLYIDSLTEEEALGLLRSESEMYALQMSQAAKTGVLKLKEKSNKSTAKQVDLISITTKKSKKSKNKSKKKNKKRFNSDETTKTTESSSLSTVETNSEIGDLITSNKTINDNSSSSSILINKEDIEMKINEYEEVEDQEEESESCDLVLSEIDPNEEKSEAISSISNNISVDIFENVFNYNMEDFADSTNLVENQQYLDENCFYYDQQTTSNISMSLRNSLLKLRHSRRHLANLIEQHNQKLLQKSSSSNGTNTPISSSSTQSSLTTTSNMSLYKQHLLNIQHNSNKMSCKPCVYMLNEGRCMRADCRFVHDLKTITCKYWLDGECLKGENCEFAHDNLPEIQKSIYSSSYGSSASGPSSSFFNSNSKKNKKQKEESIANEKPKKDFKLDTEEFPALGGFSTCTNTKTGDDEKLAATTPPVITNSINILNKENVNKESTCNKNEEVRLNLASLIKQQQHPVKTVASVLLSNVINNHKNNKPLTNNNSNNNTQKSKETTSLNKKQPITTTPVTISTTKKKNDENNRHQKAPKLTPKNNSSIDISKKK